MELEIEEKLSFRDQDKLFYQFGKSRTFSPTTPVTDDNEENKKNMLEHSGLNVIGNELK